MRLILTLALALSLMGQEFNFSAPTWADRQTGKATLGVCIGSYPPQYTSASDRVKVLRQLNLALSEWSKYVEVDFYEVTPCGGSRTLTFSWLPTSHGDWDFVPSQVAHAHLPAPAVPEPLAGDVHFWSGREWTPEEIYRTAVHEVGHALGLWESREGLMNSELGLLWLQQSDIDAIRRLYARRCAGVECAWGLNR